MSITCMKLRSVLVSPEIPTGACPQLIRVAVIATFLVTAAATVHADLAGARIHHRRLDVQFALGDSPDAVVRDVLLGDGRMVVRLAAAIAGQPEGSPAFDQPRDLTLELDRPAETIVVRPLSGTLDLSRYPDGQFTIANATDLLMEVCALLGLTGCDRAPSSPPSGRVFSATGPKPDATRDVVITLGSLPAEDATLQVAVRRDSGPSMRRRGAADRSTTVDLDAAVRRRVTEAFRAPPAAPAMRSGPRAVPPRKYFVVHCTAFGATDEQMRRWVTRNTTERRRSKSHGVILPSGEYLPMWPFTETSVWATKTETCDETESTALGAVVNIELHYFCARDRDDRASDAQYDRLARIYKDLADQYGALTIVSHREVDRGLRDGHGDPTGFAFSTFYDKLRAHGVSVDQITRISDDRHMLRTGPDLSHHWPPQVSGNLVPETQRPDDCRRDHR